MFFIPASYLQIVKYITDDVLYWVDAMHNKIEAISLDGKNRRNVITEDDAHYFGISLNGESLLISDWKTK